ncbi:MAG: hypothetical protein ABR576_08975 [Thermoanaerobaculia bacterium]
MTAPPPPGSTLVLRDGSVFLLRAPARQVGKRLVFQTRDGRVYSVEATEVQSAGAPPPRPDPPRLNRHDSRALGAIVRSERNRKGKAVEVAPKPARAAKKPRPR